MSFQESVQYRRLRLTQSQVGVQMLQKPNNHLSFISTRSYAARPLSEATEILDTDFEAEFSEEDNSPRKSVESFGNDSSTTLSTADSLPTPSLSEYGALDFQFNSVKPVEGPTGPHLFRSSLDSTSMGRHEDLEYYLSMSPLSPEVAKEQRRESLPVRGRSGSVSALDVVRHANVAVEQVRSWTPMQVAEWMYETGFEDTIVEQFIRNDISGSVLLDLQIDDLKELGIQSFGKRHRLMSEIQNLRTSEPPSPAATPIERSMSTRRVSRTASRRRSSSKDHSHHTPRSPECETPDRSKPRRRRTPRIHAEGDVISPAESVSIVAIEQLLPKLHKCSKGEDCAKYQKQQRKIARIASEFPDQFVQVGGTLVPRKSVKSPTESEVRPKSDAAPSLVASSDVLGPGAIHAFELNAENLNGVQPRDPQENVRQFLSFQHVNSPGLPEVKQQPLEMFPPLSPPQSSMPAVHMATNLKNLPKLQIPSTSTQEGILSSQRTITPSMGSRLLGSATATQEHNPYLYGQDPFRHITTTPFSEMDAPLTSFPYEPLARETSQSVPPDMQYGGHLSVVPDPIVRSGSARPDHRRRPSINTMARLDEGQVLRPIDTPNDLATTPHQATYTAVSSPHIRSGSRSANPHDDPEVTHSGRMKKRKTTRLLRHEWQDAHFTLKGTVLAMHKDETDAKRRSRALEFIDVDDYAVACSSLASSSKLTAAFKRSILKKAANLSNNGSYLSGLDEAAFAFSLIPASANSEKKHIFTSAGKSHHFAVKSRDERITWMRELMLAKALKRGKEGGGEVTVNGNVI
ncbi:hypothetical protein AJ80_01215 [Polytolypa hystricis UAMH7299]|uniref:SAM and PH domain-containing protein n=1 Tax=Polytolypa hystricis (strain UAMH7299) TaxID=1447883 RepID=A0A2B7Z0T0_POLH7|nr:hypothetical protein AJ80_01215 [Polytolypa hystricis UAMH7299]